MIGAPVGKVNFKSGAGADDRTSSLQEQSKIIDRLADDTLVDRLVGGHFRNMLHVIGGGANDLSGHADRAEQTNAGERNLHGLGGELLDLRQQAGQGRDQRIMRWRRIGHRRQAAENLGDVGDRIAIHHAEAIVIEPAKSHAVFFPSHPYRGTGC